MGAQYAFPAQVSGSYIDRLRVLGVEKSYPKGAILFDDGTRPKGVYAVLEGRVSLSINSAQGKMLVLGFYGPQTI